MNLKRGVVCLLATFGLSASMMSPTVLAQDTSGDAVVELVEAGTFAVDIAAVTQLGNVQVNAYTGNVTTSGQLVINFTDTGSYRNGFNTKLSASSFISTLPKPGGGFFNIPANNLSVSSNYISELCPAGRTILLPSEILVTTNGDGAVAGMGPFNWTTASLKTLDTPRIISRAESGPGTAASAVCDGTSTGVDLVLTVPAGTPAGTYTSTLTVDVTFNSAP